MYACGLRISEAASLEVTAIDGLNGLIRVIGKGNKERCVPLPTVLVVSRPLIIGVRKIGQMLHSPV
jgi:site-specific recombinase XerD